MFLSAKSIRSTAGGQRSVSVKGNERCDVAFSNTAGRFPTSPIWSHVRNRTEDSSLLGASFILYTV